MWRSVINNNVEGLWQDVELKTLGTGVSVRYPAVHTELPSDDLALLTIVCDVENHGTSAAKGTLTASVPGIGDFVQDVRKNNASTTTTLFIF